MSAKANQVAEKSRTFVVAICLAIAVLFVVRLNAGHISGRVSAKASGAPIAGVEIAIYATDYSAASSDSGTFTFRDVPAGMYRLTTFHPDYMPLVLYNVEVFEDKRTEIQIRLEKKPPDLDRFMGDSLTRKEGKKQGLPEARSYQKETKTGTRSEDADKIETAEPPPTGEYDVGYAERDVKPAPAKTSGLRAGFADDNEQFNYFLNFLEQYGPQVQSYSLPVRDRLQIFVNDRSGASLPGARVQVSVGDRRLDGGSTYADGSFYFYPSAFDFAGEGINVRVRYQQSTKDTVLKLDGPRKTTITLPFQRPTYDTLQLDLLFILDTTGSMGEEIERLKNTIDIINLNLASLPAEIRIHYGMVLYRDREDAYVTRKIPFTFDPESFRDRLNKVRADGGGDTPEDLQAALQVAVQEMEWRQDAVRLAFIITDAPPHLDYDQSYHYTDAARDAKKQAIKIFSVGTGGLNLQGEYVLRQIAQYTQGKYIFLTYGETGESEGGRPGSVSHHTGANYQTDKLESIIIRLVKEELAHLMDISLTAGEDYWSATSVEDEEKEETISKLFRSAIQQLIDYSSYAINEGTAVGVIPVAPNHSSLANNAEYFTERLGLALGQSDVLTQVEREDLQYLAEELGFQLSGVVDLDKAVKAGTFIGADMLIIGNLYFKDKQYELFLKLVRVETAEVLSVTRLKIDPMLGL